MKLPLVLISVLALPAVAQSNFNLHGFTTARTSYVTGQPSWTTGGFGRLDAGADGVDKSATRTIEIANIGADWTPTSWLTVHAQGIARHEPAGTRGRKTGVTEAFLDLHNEHWQLRAGEFFLPTSRENHDMLWASPYTISFSALNAWIGQEFRPLGVDLQWKPNFYFSAGATAFRGNDTLGAQIAWRGWTIGNRLSVYNELLPLPPLFSIGKPGQFVDQRDGSTAFGRDLDGRTGWAARVRAQLPERALVQFTRVDNRGDRELYRGEYSWQTRFNIVGAQIGNDDATTLIGEYSWGSTGMGEEIYLDRPFVQMDFDTAYVLVSRKSGKVRTSARYDYFKNEERDFSKGENNDEHGSSWTIAAFYEPNPHTRTGIEFTQVTGRRIAAEQSGFSGNTDGHSLTLELRYRF
jgi:hypothetical protein